MGSLNFNGRTPYAFSGGKITLHNRGSNFVTTGTGAVLINSELGFEQGLNFSGTGTSPVTITGNIAGLGGLSKDSTGILKLTGTNSYRGQTLVRSGTLQIESNRNLGSGLEGLALSPNAILEKVGSDESLEFRGKIELDGELMLSAGSLALNQASVILGTLHISGDSTIDFGDAQSILSINKLVIDPGVKLTILNWKDLDYFLAQQWQGAMRDVADMPPMNQIVYTGDVNGTAIWDPGLMGTSQIRPSGWVPIRPIPEPRVYGAALSLLTTLGSLGLLRRFRQRA